MTVIPGFRAPFFTRLGGVWFPAGAIMRFQAIFRGIAVFYRGFHRGV
jgi:hypothetical protein